MKETSNNQRSETMSMELKSIPLASLFESKTNPRKHFDEQALNDLANNIKEVGIVSPLLVRPSGAQFEIVAGARRYRASKIAKLTEVPAFVRELSDEATLEIQALENLQRQDVHPLDEAESYNLLINKYGYSAESIAAKVGKTPAYVYQRRKLVELVDSAKKAFWAGLLPLGHASIVAKLQAADQKRAVAFALKTWQDFEGSYEYRNELNPEAADEPRDGFGDPARTVCSLKDLEEFIRLRIHLDLREAAFDKKDGELLPKAGSCILCPKRSGFNKELFSDITKDPDICTDPACFALKQQAHVERLKDSLKKEKKRFIEVTADQRKPEGHAGAITERSFKKISGKPCKHARIGIYIDGANMGHTITLCNAKRECKQHWAEYQKQRAKHTPGASTDRISYEEERRLEEEKRQRGRRRFGPVAREIWKNMPKTLPKKLDLVAMLAELIWDKIAYDFREFKPKEMKPTREQIINAGLLCQKFTIDLKWDGSIHPDLYKAAKSLGVKFEPILQKIENEEKAAKAKEASKSKDGKKAA